jgi:hypothetical protein
VKFAVSVFEADAGQVARAIRAGILGHVLATFGWDDFGAKAESFRLLVAMSETDRTILDECVRAGIMEYAVDALETTDTGIVETALAFWGWVIDHQFARDIEDEAVAALDSQRLSDALHNLADDERFAAAVAPLIQAYEELHEAQFAAR